MATKKKTVYVDTAWEYNDDKYPTKRGICYCCDQRDDLKLSFDQIHYICLNSHSCLLRRSKQLQEAKGL